MKIRLTQRIVASMTTGDRFVDTEVPGLEVRHQGGVPTYALRYRKRRHGIGRHGAPWTVEGARTEARKMIVKIDGGDMPVGMGITVRDLATRFLDEHVTVRLAAGTQREYRGHLNDHIVPALGGKRAAAVTFDDADRLHLGLKDRQVLANRVMATLSAMYGWARKKRIIPANVIPTLGIEKFREEERHTPPTADEADRIANAFEALKGKWSPSALGALKLVLLTGMRRDEARNLRWSEVRLEDAQLRLEVSKTGSKVVHLSPAAVDLLEAMPRLEGNPYVFYGDVPGKPYVALNKCWSAVLRTADVKGVRIHDLRHHFATEALRDGASLSTVGKLLGHADAKTTARYAKVVDEVAAAAAAKTGDRIGARLKS